MAWRNRVLPGQPHSPDTEIADEEREGGRGER